MNEPHWMPLARGYLGLAETPGKATAPTIARWLVTLRAWWTDDETPWCGTFVGAIFQQAGIALPKHWYRAKAWLEWGQTLHKPLPGCVVVFDRAGGGHVGFLVGVDRGGRLLVLGGNQNNRVSIAPFAHDRVLGYRWPAGEAYTPLQPVPVLASNAAVSTNEA
jgi:uncharacterized protein (TIGR02594 family)